MWRGVVLWLVHVTALVFGFITFTVRWNCCLINRLWSDFNKQLFTYSFVRHIFLFALSQVKLPVVSAWRGPGALLLTGPRRARSFVLPGLFTHSFNHFRYSRLHPPRCSFPFCGVSVQIWVFWGFCWPVRHCWCWLLQTSADALWRPAGWTSLSLSFSHLHGSQQRAVIVEVGPGWGSNVLSSDLSGARNMAARRGSGRWLTWHFYP